MQIKLAIWKCPSSLSNHRRSKEGKKVNMLDTVKGLVAWPCAPISRTKESRWSVTEAITAGSEGTIHASAGTYSRLFLKCHGGKNLFHRILLQLRRSIAIDPTTIRQDDQKNIKWKLTDVSYFGRLSPFSVWRESLSLSRLTKKLHPGKKPIVPGCSLYERVN